MGGEAFKRRLVHSVALAIINFVPLLKSFTANVLKCTAHLIKLQLNTCRSYN